MKRVPNWFVVLMALALWLSLAAAVNAETHPGTITRCYPKTMTIDYECSDGTVGWPNAHIATAAEFMDCVKWQAKGTPLVADFKGKQDGSEVKSIKPQ